MLQILFLLFSFCILIDGDSISDCSKYKDCASCVKSYRPLPGFKRFCGWHTDRSVCDEPLSLVSGKSVVVREPFMCPRKAPPDEEHPYTDTLGRSLFSLVLAVRNKDPTECLANSQPNVQLIKRYEVECDQSHNLCASMLAVSESNKSIYVVYKSSNMDKQLITEFIHMVAAQLGVWQNFEGGGGVATYFHGAFERLFKGSGMKDDLIKLKKKYPGYEVWCTGHSLGGSLSSMTALYLIKKEIFPAKLVRLVTFGEPRTGNVAFAQAVEENVKVRYRVVHRGDPITNMPASINPIGLLLSPTIAERQGYFYRYLVYYDNDMKKDNKFSICTLSGDYACRNLVLANNPLDHISYFDVNADLYLSKGCKGDQLTVIGNKTERKKTTTTTTKTTKTTITTITTTTTTTTIATTATATETATTITTTAATTATSIANAADSNADSVASDNDTTTTDNDAKTTDSDASANDDNSATTDATTITDDNTATTDSDADTTTTDTAVTDTNTTDTDTDTTDADSDTTDSDTDTTATDTEITTTASTTNTIAVTDSAK
ncbi:Lipase family protein [Brugia malayi]|uniref:Lipase family protein n=1 Tax=Brugia malayi TaxID=6279 RepID=A0A4E9F141_BRUMA|nr:Lipase family protein [Brugia malayi]VIO89890.1 Lipase family protein [Brugia malayi]